MSGNDKNRNFRVLIVDDDDSTRSLLSSVLNAEGYECLTANSVASADAILRQEPVQLALLDLYLGTANGLNVLDLTHLSLACRPRSNSLPKSCRHRRKMTVRNGTMSELCLTRHCEPECCGH